MISRSTVLQVVLVPAGLQGGPFGVGKENRQGSLWR